jgi:Mg2+/Co2+ transporter CorB
MPLPRPASPRTLWADLRAFTREGGRHKWIAAFFAIVMPIVIVIGFIVDSRTNIMPGEQVIYAESWSANRTDEEIRAAQEEREKERQAIAAERQRQFKELEKKFGI